MQVDAATRPTQHLDYIDALRGVAVAAVLVTHVATTTHLPGMGGKLFAFTAKGVQLFYVVSALTLMFSMNKRSRSERNPLTNFFLRRVFRIAPAFYFILLVYCLLGRFTTGLAGIRPTSLPHALLIMSFFNGWRPDVINTPVVGQWSIAVEMMFYLLLPFLFPILTTFRRAVCAWFLALALNLIASPLAIRLATAEGFTSPEDLKGLAYWWFPNQLSIFMCGIGVYFIVSQGLPLWRSMLPYLGGALLLWGCHYFYPETSFFPLVGVVIMFGVILLSRRPVRALVNPVTRFLGKVSFSAYLCHPLILIFVDLVVVGLHLSNAKINFVLSYALLLALVCPVAFLMWTLIENPFQNLGRRVIAKLEVRHPLSAQLAGK